jgi:hypothetical protein
MSKKKYIVGLGCSWAQGEGGYPEHIWKEYNGRVNLRCVPDEHLRTYEHENSWVNVLSRDYFPEYTPINLGVRGIGNDAAVNQLHFCDRIDWNNSTGYIVLLMSGLERLTFFQQQPKRRTGHDDGYSNGNYAHYKWRPAFPVSGEGGEEEPLWSVYAKMLYSEQFVASNTMMALLNLQTFAKTYGYKVIVANAFYSPPGNTSVKDYLIKHTGTLAMKFNWDTYLHDKTKYIAMVQRLVELDGKMNPKDWGGHQEYYLKLPWPEKYLTNCIHPTIDGYKFIAHEMANFIKTYHM